MQSENPEFYKYVLGTPPEVAQIQNTFFREITYNIDYLCNGLLSNFILFNVS